MTASSVTPLSARALRGGGGDDFALLDTFNQFELGGDIFVFADNIPFDLQRENVACGTEGMPLGSTIAHSLAFEEVIQAVAPRGDERCGAVHKESAVDGKLARTGPAHGNDGDAPMPKHHVVVLRPTHCIDVIVIHKGEIVHGDIDNFAQALPMQAMRRYRHTRTPNEKSVEHHPCVPSAQRCNAARSLT